jgi:hypothetical protein
MLFSSNANNTNYFLPFKEETHTKRRRRRRSATSMATRASVLGLYRRLLREVQKFPCSTYIGNKVGVNVRLVFNVRLHERDSSKITEYYEHGIAVERMLCKLRHQRPEDLKMMFRKGEIFDVDMTQPNQ